MTDLSSKLFFAVLLVGWASSLNAKEQKFQVVSWPESGQPVLTFTFSRFKELGGASGKERTYTTDVTAKNLSSKRIAGAAFLLYVFDKDKARIGEGYMNVTDIAANETVKFQMTLRASGTPSSVSLSAAPSESRTISITVNSVPQGAAFKVDGREAGTTPKMIEIGNGKHILEFVKEGFNSGTFPLEITPHDVSGGSISYELGNSAHDTIELRDGSVLAGDLVSVQGMQVEVRVGGNTQTLDRNQIRRILLTERSPVSN
ncbi:MAG TPA: PEGA domain-containing protein [Candidatus Sulfotelmatobacter sp.]|jgi:hypothetical protein